jgi:outer membrane protein, heavy metal efflux system
MTPRTTLRRLLTSMVPLFGLAQAAPARAEGRLEDPPPALSLDDALARAEARAAQVRAAEHGVLQARSRAVGAGVVVPVNPRISADVRPPITGGGWRDLGYGVSGEIAFEVGGAPGARRREAAAGVETARAGLAVVRREARARAWEAYVRAKAAEMRVGETRASEDLARRVLDAMRLRADLGASGDIDASTAALDVAQLAAAGESATRELGLRTMELREALDVPAASALVLTTALGDPPPAPAAASLVSRAAAARPELAELRSRRALLEATDERLAREALPRLGLYGGVDAAPLSPIFGVAGVSIDLPVAQRNQGPRARIASERALEIERLAIEERRIEREVIAASDAYASRRAELARLRDDALPAAERAFGLIETGWRAGRFDVFRLTAAARDVVRTRAQRLDALEGAWIERGALDRAAGGGL